MWCNVENNAISAEKQEKLEEQGGKYPGATRASCFPFLCFLN